MPYDPERVLSKLDVQLRTPTPPGPPAANSWFSQTPHNPQEANLQAELMMARISRGPNSSPTVAVINQFKKGATAMIHRMSLLETENRVLREANEALSKRRRAKKTRVQHAGPLTAQGKQDLEDQQAIEKQLMQENQRGGGGAKGARTRAPCCSICKKPGHNARTCKGVIEASNLPTSNVINIDS